MLFDRDSCPSELPWLERQCDKGDYITLDHNLHGYENEMKPIRRNAEKYSESKRNAPERRASGARIEKDQIERHDVGQYYIPVSAS
jgi:hypothetical protein